MHHSCECGGRERGQDRDPCDQEPGSVFLNRLRAVEDRGEAAKEKRRVVVRHDIGQPALKESARCSHEGEAGQEPVVFGKHRG